MRREVSRLYAVQQPLNQSRTAIRISRPEEAVCIMQSASFFFIEKIFIVDNQQV
jgi:hypothetical protein